MTQLERPNMHIRSEILPLEDEAAFFEVFAFSDERGKGGVENLVGKSEGFIKALTNQFIANANDLDIDETGGPATRDDVHRHQYRSLLKLAQILAEAKTKDRLTNLFNKESLYERIDMALARRLEINVGTQKRNTDGAALIIVDLDLFKPINDTYGHAAGDLVLKEVARILKENTRGTDTCARVGGDEFAVLLDGASEERAKQVLNSLDKIFQTASLIIDGNKVPIRASLGMAMANDNSTAEELDKQADAAMYVAKKQNSRPRTLNLG